MANIYLYSYYLFYCNIAFYLPSHFILLTPCLGTQGVKKQSRRQKCSSFSLSSQKSALLHPDSPLPFHLCLSRSSGRVKLSKSVLIIRTGTACLPACLPVCVCVFLSVLSQMLKGLSLSCCLPVSLHCVPHTYRHTHTHQPLSYLRWLCLPPSVCPSALLAAPPG